MGCYLDTEREYCARGREGSSLYQTQVVTPG